MQGAGSRGHGGLIRLALGAVIAATLLVAAPPAMATTLPAGFSETTLASGLTSPTQVAWAPDGRMFTNEGGSIKTYAPGSTTKTTVGNVGGFLYGLGVDANFASNHYLYAVYASGQNARVARLQVNPTNYTLTSTTVILGKFPLGACPAPSNTVDCIRYFDGTHTVGTVLSDPRDGTLWIGIGDSASPGFVDTRAFDAQNEQALYGKILHTDRNGNGLPGHPLCASDTNLTHVCTKVHSTGMRNPYRFTLRPGSRGLAVGDTGWESREEFDLVKTPGKNYGWPCYEGKIRTPGYSADARCPPMYAKEGTAGAAVPPVYDYARGAGGAAMIGGPTYVSGAYPDDFDGDIFFSDYVLHYIKRLDLDANDNFVAVKNFATAAGAPVDLQIAPNGNLTYVDFEAGNIRQIRFAGAGTNTPPTAKAAANPASGPAPLAVSFSSAGSIDPDGSALTYDWNFGDGSAHSTAANPSHTYSDGTKNFTATLTVKDPQGATGTATVTVSPGNRAPTPSITAPATYRNEQAVSLSGSASDPEQGTLPASALAWDIDLIHIDHEHPLSNPTGVSQTSFTPLIDHDADSYYRVTLTATDARGVKGSKTVLINPETRQFTLASSPSGAPVTYGGGSHTTPFTKRSAIGFKTSISAAQTFSTGGQNYEFVSWSDGGARLHDITIPAADSTITATYRPVTGTPPTRKALLVVRNGASLQASDAAVRSRLQSLGFTVTSKSETATAADASGMNLVVISSTVAPLNVGQRFRTVGVPVLTWEAQLYDDMGMTAAQGDFKVSQTQVTIADPANPLAAGLTGNQAVTTSASSFAWGIPSSTAKKAATLLGDSTRSAIFSYEKGVVMPGLTAPARRVGFFFSNSNSTMATANGWKLFDAAVNWARTP